MAAKSSTPSYGQCFATLTLGSAPFFLLLAVFAMFGANTVTHQGQYIHGIEALIICLVFTLIFAAVYAGFQKLGYVILNLFRRNRSEPQT